jgi:hypothetical protein
LKRSNILLEEFNLTSRQKILLLVFIFITSVFLLSNRNLQGSDWFYYFYPPAKMPFDPYSVDGFMNPPWTAILLFPLSLFPFHISTLLNSSLAIVVFSALVLHKNGNLLSLILTITSVPVFLLSGIGNIDWLPALGFFFANEWGIILMLIKPQNGLFAGIDWYYRQQNKARFIIIPFVFVAISFVIWGNWFLDMYHNINANTTKDIYNLTIFPWAVPIGFGLVIYILKNKPENGEFLGTLATFCLFPYFTGNSLAILFTLVSIKYPKISIIIWVLSWGAYLTYHLIN